MKRLLPVLLVFLFAAPLKAQTPTIQPGEKIRLAWEHDGLQGPQFRLYLDGVVVKNFTSADLVVTPPVAPATDNTYTTADGVVPVFATSQIGPHKYELAAYNALGESPRFALAVNVNWTGPPTAPKSLRTFTPKLAWNSETGQVTLYLVEDPR